MLKLIIEVPNLTSTHENLLIPTTKDVSGGGL
jgi:hypothetical protein